MTMGTGLFLLAVGAIYAFGRRREAVVVERDPRDPRY